VSKASTSLKHGLKQAVLRGARLCGVNALSRFLARRRLTVLCYHSVVGDSVPYHPTRTRVAVTANQFREQLQVARRCFQPVSVEHILRHLDGADRLPPRPLLVTFDDGFRNNLTYAAPELERQGIPAVFHVTTGYVGTSRLLWPYEVEERVLQWTQPRLPMPGDRSIIPLPTEPVSRAAVAERVQGLCKTLHDDARQAYLEVLRAGGECRVNGNLRELHDFLTWDEVRDLDRRGFAIGSHTVEHPVLTRLPRERCQQELRDSKATIERQLGRACHCIAYPNGGPDDVSTEVFNAAAEAGFRFGFTLKGGRNPALMEPLAIDRICIVREMTIDAFHARLSGTAALYRRWAPQTQ
jgi:peptidoglycan/xylan/chitin deacetylase (PgdA/CDA1 family)